MFNDRLESRINRLEKQMFQLLLQLASSDKDKIIREQAEEIEKLKSMLNAEKNNELASSFKIIGDALMSNPD
jgi:hypothetical protein